MKREKLLKVGYVRGKIKHLIIPYMTYLVLDMLLVRKTLSVHDWIYALWGGRAVMGVYWYITCFIFAVFMLTILLKKFSDKMVKGLILAGGGYSDSRIAPCGKGSCSAVSWHSVESGRGFNGTCLCWNRVLL